MSNDPLSLPETDPACHWRQNLTRLEGAYSPHTVRGYRADFAQFENWCSDAGICPLPASPHTIAAHIDAAANRLANATLKRRIAAIRKIHRLSGCPDPTVDEDVLLALRRARRGKPSRQHQALGVTKKLRERMLGACGDDLAGLRNKALIAVGYDTLCRRGELVALRAEDIAERPSGGANLLVRRAKNDPDGNGRMAALSRGTLETLRNWLKAAGIESGPIFRPVYRGHAVHRVLSPMTVSRVLKTAAHASGMDPAVVEEISGHSMRVGCAQDLNTAGHDILTIMRAGGWRSMAVVARYIERVDLTIWD
jgi:site-specific recombinase XerD